MNKYNEISDYFIALAGATGSYISNLKLQKLMYYVQAWHLAIYEEPMFNSKFEAWVHGPVLPELYVDYKSFGYTPISLEKYKDADDCDKYIKTFKVNLGEKASFIEEVTEEYFGEDAYTLEDMTHKETPWIEARNGLPPDVPSNNIISEDTMKDFYKKYIAA